jgi:hypothetical protein
MLSFLSGRELEKGNLGPLLFKHLRIQSTTIRARSVLYQAILVERFARDVVGKLTGAEEHGELKRYVHKVFPWTEIRAAHEQMEGNKNSGKIIVEVQLGVFAVGLIQCTTSYDAVAGAVRSLMFMCSTCGLLPTTQPLKSSRGNARFDRPVRFALTLRLFFPRSYSILC